MLMRRFSILLSLGLGLAASAAAALPRDALWLVVRSCVMAQRTIGTPFPCLKVQLPSGDVPGHAVLRAPGSATHVIVTPTVHVPGIEARELLRDSAGAYWRAALDSRRFVIEGAGGRVRLDAVGLALNSAETRSQDQLHIHAECFRPDVMASLRAHPPSPGSGWHPVRGTIDRERYLVRGVTHEELGSANLFGLLATVPGAGGDLSRSKVLLVEASDHLLLAVTRSSQRSIESLLDDGCTATARAG